MSPDASRWRSSAEYDYLDDLIASDLAWEYLRRNPEYQRDYAQIGGRATGVEQATKRLRLRWGLRFRGSPGAQHHGAAGVLDAGSRPGDGAPDPLALDGRGPCRRIGGG
ncbi:transcriptional regulator domain-containing protein [Phenylobacterium sp.]|uniref:transcriptional regulator domain-containing protein n=1 Tax=Phenylobacterium sp. TaxID=1871053 RepID=UPI003BAAA979